MMVNHYFPLKVDVPLSIENSWKIQKTGKGGWNGTQGLTVKLE